MYDLCMIDLYDIFGMGFEEEPEMLNDFEQQASEAETEGGWGSFFIGGAIDALVGSNLKGVVEKVAEGYTTIPDGLKHGSGK